MEIREMLEQREQLCLSDIAMLSQNSKGREFAENPCTMRTCFQRDRDRIVHSKAFRRLGHKTQVFISPEGDHYRARLTHTLEVMQIARTIARALQLNEDLVEAIALGHDLGHTPFGHAGERALNEVCPNGFRHNEQSARVVKVLERDGKGLNLTYEVIDGIQCHTGEKKADTNEGRIVHFADRIAYINHDIDDAVRAGMLKNSDIPNTLGMTHKERINTMVTDMILYGKQYNKIGMSIEIRKNADDLRTYMFKKVYRSDECEIEAQKAQGIVKSLYEYFYKNSDKLPYDYKCLIEKYKKEIVVCDYIAGMTDRYASSKFSQLFIPKSWNIIKANEF